METLKRLWYRFLVRQACPVHATHPKLGKKERNGHDPSSRDAPASNAHTWKSHGGFRH